VRTMGMLSGRVGRNGIIGQRERSVTGARMH